LFILQKKEEDVEAAKTIFKRPVGNSLKTIAALTIVFLFFTSVAAFFYFRINFTDKDDRFIFQCLLVFLVFCTSVLSIIGSFHIIPREENNHIKILSWSNFCLILIYYIGEAVYLRATHKE